MVDWSLIREPETRRGRDSAFSQQRREARELCAQEWMWTLFLHIATQNGPSAETLRPKITKLYEGSRGNPHDISLGKDFLAMT